MVIMAVTTALPTSPVSRGPAATSPGRTRGAQPWVVGCSAVALGPMVVVHLVGNGIVDPVVQPISHYAFVPTGYQMILIGSILLATAAIAIATVMVGHAHRAGAARLGLPAALLVSFAVAMLLVGLVPTDPPGTTELTWGATVHRWSAAYAFAVMPVIGLLACRCEALGARSRAQLWALSLAVCIGTAVVFAIHLPLAVQGSHIPGFGLVERIGFIVMVAFLVVLSGMLRMGATAAPVPAAQASELSAAGRPRTLVG